MAVGIPGIDGLTQKVAEHLDERFKTQYEKIKSQLQGNSNVENILDRIRMIKELIGKSEEKEYDGIKGTTSAKHLETAICRAICQIIRNTTPKELKTHIVFAQWMRAFQSKRNSPIEIFTTNYDLLLEQSMEKVGLPFFDGFIGSVNPFFIPESVEAELEKTSDLAVYPPRIWVRLWKLHGSINWFIHRERDGEKGRIVRFLGSEFKEGEELVIFPSREKYMESRKLPYLAFHDRLRKFLFNGETLLIILGYSFSDEHLNEIIFQGLRSNPHLAVMALIFGVEKEVSGRKQLCLPEELIKYGKEYRNFSVYGPNKACIGGNDASWSEPSKKTSDKEDCPFWEGENGIFKLGDFNHFVSFLEKYIGFNASNVGTIRCNRITSGGLVS